MFSFYIYTYQPEAGEEIRKMRFSCHKKKPKTKIKKTSRVETGDKKTGTTGLS
jgi:hypothetical protein